MQRELGLDRVVKLASNEGPWGPFPAALEALERSAGTLNRYPDGGAFHLRNAIAERHGVDTANVITGAGADAIIGHLSVATLDPGDEVVTAWPSFISYVLDALKLGAVPRKVPLVDDHYDLDALLDAVGPKTKLVYIATPNNPTGTMTTREQLDAYFERVPEHVLTVLDQAYFEYIDRADYPDGDRRVRRGRPPSARAADVLEDLRARRPAGRLRRRPGRRDPGDRQDAPRVRRRHAGAGRRAREHGRRRRARRAAPPHRRGPRRRSSGRCASTGSSPPAPRSRTSSSSRSARTRRRSSTRCSARARSSGRWARSARPERSADHGRHPGRERLLRRGARLRQGGDDLDGSAILGPVAGARPAFLMRTTLKRGIGRGAAVNGNGRAVLPPGVALADHDLPPAGAAAALALGVRPHRARLGGRRPPRR